MCNYVVICRADSTCGQRPSLCFVCVLFPLAVPPLLDGEKGKVRKISSPGPHPLSVVLLPNYSKGRDISPHIVSTPVLRPTVPHIQRMLGQNGRNIKWTFTSMQRQDYF